MKTPPIRRCNICEALWVEGCDANQRAWWCKECKRVSDNCEAPAFIVRSLVLVQPAMLMV